MKKNQKNRLIKNKEYLKSCGLKFEVIAAIVQENLVVKTSVLNLQKLIQNANPSDEKDILKIDKKIAKKVNKLKSVALKESKKNKYKKLPKLLKLLEISIIERGCFNRMLNPCDEKDFVVENGILTKYKGIDSVVVLPNSIKVIGEKAFNRCETINEIVFNDSINVVMSNAFEMCKTLKSVVLSESVTSVGDSAFYNCPSLVSVVMEEGISKIGHYAFAKCPVLEAIKIPKSLVSIGDNAFLFDKNLNKKSQRKIKKINKKAL